jgi:hypothetical protein
MASTFYVRLNELSGTSGLKVFIYPYKGPLVNSGGDTLTEDGGDSGLFSATVAESANGEHLYYVGTTATAVTARGKVYCDGPIWIGDSPAPIIYQAKEVSADDTNAIDFLWPRDGSTITGEVAIDGGAFAAVAGPISQTGITAAGYYQYRLAYNAADRPSAEGVAFYRFNESGQRSEYLTLVVGPSLAGLNTLGTGSATVQSPVSERGTIPRIFIGDDYLAIHERAFLWTIAEPVGFVAATSTCSFGAQDENGNGWLVSGSITDLGSTWRLSFNLTKTDTAVAPGVYDWTVEVKSAAGAEHTVSFGGETVLQEKYT